MLKIHHSKQDLEYIIPKTSKNPNIKFTKRNKKIQGTIFVILIRKY